MGIKKVISALLLVSMLTMMLSAVPVGADANKLSVRIFIKYANPVEQTTANVVDIGDNNGYELLGLWWDLGKYPSGVPYIINPKNSYRIAKSDVVAEVKASLESWDATVTVELYNDNPTVDTRATTSTRRPDYKNVITWGPLRPGIVAQTTIWYYSATGEIVDADITLNSSYKWGIDRDDEGTGYTLTKAFDIQDIVTHEAGHWSGLGDIYDTTYRAMTMYGYTTYGETIKISLEPGDIAGVQAVYGA